MPLLTIRFCCQTGVLVQSSTLKSRTHTTATPHQSAVAAAAFAGAASADDAISRAAGDYEFGTDGGDGEGVPGSPGTEPELPGLLCLNAVILKPSSMKPRAIHRQRGGNSNAWDLHDELRARFDILKKRGPAWGYQGVVINIFYAVVAD